VRILRRTKTAVSCDSDHKTSEQLLYARVVELENALRDTFGLIQAQYLDEWRLRPATRATIEELRRRGLRPSGTP
jgi:hypothetical protein